MEVDTEKTQGRRGMMIGRGLLGLYYGFVFGLLSGAVVMLLAWGYSPRALILGVAIAVSTAFIGLVSALATGTTRGGSAVIKSAIGGLVASPAFLAVTTIGIPRLFESRAFGGEHKRVALIVLKSVSPVHFAFGLLIGLIIGTIIARMKEETYFVLSPRR